MTTAATPDETQKLRSKYQMEARPESVSRLAALLSVRGADMEQIAKLISADCGLTERLLEGDVPAFGALQEVERQVMRLGIEPILVMNMADPLKSAVTRTFQTMCGLTVKGSDVGLGEASAVTRFTSSLEIKGRANGKVYLRIDEKFCTVLAAKTLSLPPEELTSFDLLDVLAELSNMIVGSFQSNLCDAGLTSRISVPEVVADTPFHPPKVSRGRHRVFGFHYDGMVMLADLLVEFAN